MIVLGRLLQAEEIGFLYFEGTMSAEERASTVQMFGNDANIKVLVSFSGASKFYSRPTVIQLFHRQQLSGDITNGRGHHQN